MGLDMYAHALPKHTNRPVVDFDVQILDHEDAPLIHNWRKHPNLHGFMAALYFEKGGTSKDFNISTLELTTEDIDKLELAIKNHELPQTFGFFFGETTGQERDDDLAFIEKCREDFKKGRAIAYYAWW
jgi:hypothetical protein